MDTRTCAVLSEIYSEFVRAYFIIVREHDDDDDDIINQYV